MIDRRQFMHLGSKAQCTVAAEMANEIGQVFHKRDGQIPLALALGVLRIVEKELLDNNE